MKHTRLVKADDITVNINLPGDSGDVPASVEDAVDAIPFQDAEPPTLNIPPSPVIEPLPSVAPMDGGETLMIGNAKLQLRSAGEFLPDEDPAMSDLGGDNLPISDDTDPSPIGEDGLELQGDGSLQKPSEQGMPQSFDAAQEQFNNLINVAQQIVDHISLAPQEQNIYELEDLLNQYDFSNKLLGVTVENMETHITEWKSAKDSKQARVILKRPSIKAQQ